MPARDYPFVPRSATQLREGEIIPVEASDGLWACLQVVELKPRARTDLVIAILPWRGDRQPTAEEVSGLEPSARALTGIEIFTEGGLAVHGWAPLNDTHQEQFFGPSYVGKSTTVWGWQACIRQAQRYASTGMLGR